MSESGSFRGCGRNKRTANAVARSIAAALLRNYLDIGQPFAGCDDQDVPDDEAQRIADAIEALAEKLCPVGRGYTVPSKVPR